MTENKTYCGFVALVGLPNAGKSTLLNACVGAKITGVSAKPQTTRNRILGIRCVEQTQILFLDTPGLHDHKKLLNRMMNSEAWQAMSSADVVAYLVDVNRGWQDDDTVMLQRLMTNFQNKLVLVMAQCDRQKAAEVALQCKLIEAEFRSVVLEQKFPQEQILPYKTLSAKRPEDVQGFLMSLKSQLPEGPWLYPEDDLTDRSQEFICAELIREQMFRQLGQELPYHVAVVIKAFRRTEKGIHIEANLVVGRETHKAMVIGAKGQRLKSLGIQARMTLEKTLGCPVVLKLMVHVKENWTEEFSLVSKLTGLNPTEEKST
jgi:GTP-binding protein Era